MKIYKIIIITLFIGLSSYAQDLQLGIKAGANLANTWIEFEQIETNPRVGVNIGALLDLRFNSRVHLQLESQYSREGNNDGFIDYINVPAILKLYPIKDKFYLGLGPQIGFLTSAEGGDQGLKSTNLVFNFGLGYEDPKGFIINFRFGAGLSSIIGEDIIVETPGLDINVGQFKALTHVFQLSMGYKFDL